MARQLLQGGIVIGEGIHENLKEKNVWQRKVMDLKIRVRKTKEELNEKGGKKEEKTQKKREKENW